MIRTLALLALGGLTTISIIGCAEKTTASAPIARPADPAPAESSPSEPTWGVPALDLPSLNTSGRVKVVPGKVTVIMFFATWHEPSKKAFPKLQDLVDRDAARGLVLVAISVDDAPMGVAEFARVYGARFPVAWDEDLKVAHAWRPNMMPTFFIIDRNGKNQGHRGGWHDGEEKDFAAVLEPLLTP